MMFVHVSEHRQKEHQYISPCSSIPTDPHLTVVGRIWQDFHSLLQTDNQRFLQDIQPTKTQYCQQMHIKHQHQVYSEYFLLCYIYLGLQFSCITKSARNNASGSFRDWYTFCNAPSVIMLRWCQIALQSIMAHMTLVLLGCSHEVNVTVSCSRRIACTLPLLQETAHDDHTNW